MEKYPEVIVVGSHAPGILMRTKRIPVAGETVMGWGYEEPVDGGKGSNQAIAAARLGLDTAFIGCVGNDRIGKIAREWMSNAGVDTHCLYEVDNLPTGIGFILLNEDGIPAMATSAGANYALNENLVRQGFETLGPPRVLLTQFEIRPEIALFAAEFARTLGAISIINPAPAANIAIRSLSVANILVPNETEAKTLLGIDVEEEVDGLDLAIELKNKCGCESVLVTMGKYGLAGADSCGTWIMATPKVEVVDTSGAGDVFCAALAKGLIDGLDPRSSADWAVKVASLSVMKPGTIPAFPTIQEAEVFNDSINNLVSNV